ncbi:MAG: glycosyltransferase family 4 protein [Acetobacter sp.]|jgi:glycosyltransferase involved in cell wall biosynthesis|nr:glycosyltransferase family 4 protein [Acetobacter sp.]MCH4061139.1 glycosyltransferase family 4 protein [Acetobacter sp.]MCH4088077.1 glycosyltransferase family 4 protein [Acetobacter sp.]MCI1293309.1 glycosyltransferase family 4 protein [Acetobacter sp.]MCI1320066.1 glycosyltransferase family 4 protein [Acetobacter sp.]
MKILEITNVDFSLHHFLLPLMETLRERGDEVVGVCAPGPLVQEAREKGFRIVTIPMARSLSPFAQIRAIVALIRTIRRERPDVVHAHMPISGLLARLAAKFCNVPIIAYTCHGYLFNQPGSWLRRGSALVLEYLAGRITDIYLTVSEEEAADAKRLRIHSNPVAVGNGRDPKIFRPDSEARLTIRTELGTPDDRPVIIAVSRLVRHKGYPELLAAMEQVPDAELWIVGERLPSDHGESLDEAFTKAETALGSRLKRLGYRKDIARLLAASDIFVLPSHFEGLPMSIIEAMMCGLPVVSTLIRGPREQVLNGETGLLVPPGKVAPLAAALRRLATSPELCRKMGLAGRRRAISLFDQKIVLGRIAGLLHTGTERGVFQAQSSPSRPM